jgi:hypothetical protein
MDRESGVLSGTPDASGACPVIIVVNAGDDDTVLCDAVSIVITVSE